MLDLDEKGSNFFLWSILCFISGFSSFQEFLLRRWEITNFDGTEGHEDVFRSGKEVIWSFKGHKS